MTNHPPASGPGGPPTGDGALELAPDWAGLWAQAAWLRNLARQLGCSDTDAEDAVQEALLAAKDRGGLDERDGSVRGWLRVTLLSKIRMRRREESRRRLRERLVAKAEAAPGDPLGALEREELGARLAAAVAELPQADRELIALRHAAGLSPAAIATSLGLTPNAVSSRLFRIHRKVRERMERDERPPLHAVLTGPLAGPLAALSAIAMKKTTLIAAASLLAVTLGWALRENLAPVDPGAGVDTAVRPAESLLDVDVDAGGEAPAPSPVATSGPESSERVTVETAAAPAPAATEAQVESPAPTGSLLVKITERGTGLPAKNVAVSTLLGSENGDGGWMPWALSQRRVTDAEGRAFFGELPTQELTVYLHRVGGGGDFDAEGATIVAGDTVTVEFTVDETQRAHGRVVDETNRGVEGARIWLDDGGGPASTDGAFVASSGPDGRFEVPYAGPLQSLIAVKPGYAPSLSTVMSVHDNAEVDGITLVLPTRRGRVFGKVLDANGRPAPGVRVVLETENSSVNDPETGEWTGFWTTAPVLQRSGEDGSFDFEDVGVGSYQLLARVPGGARTALACDVTDGGNHELALRLRRGGIVRGTVTGEDGGPVEAATIRVVQGQDLSLSRQETATDAEGNYELRGVPSGDVELALEGSDYVSRSKETIHVTDGQTTLWNPVVRAPARLRGTLRSSAGEPLAQWRISTAGRWHATDSSGTFDFAVETRDSYTIEVRIPGMLFGDPLLSVPDAALEDGPFDLAIPAAEVPSGSVVGRVVTSDGSPWSGEVRLTLNTEGVFFQQIDTDEDGRFAFGNVPPASGKLELQNTAPAMDPVPVAVEAAMAADLGEIVIGGAE